MKKNRGNADRIIRLVLTALLYYLNLNGYLHGVALIISWIFTGIFTVTALFGSCPLYTALGIQTCGRKKVI